MSFQVMAPPSLLKPGVLVVAAINLRGVVQNWAPPDLDGSDYRAAKIWGLYIYIQ